MEWAQISILLLAVLLVWVTFDSIGHRLRLARLEQDVRLIKRLKAGKGTPEDIDSLLHSGVSWEHPQPPRIPPPPPRQRRPDG